MTKKYKTILPPHLLNEAKTKVEDFLAKVRKVEMDLAPSKDYDIQFYHHMTQDGVRGFLETGSCKNIIDFVGIYARDVKFIMSQSPPERTFEFFQVPESKEKFQYWRNSSGSSYNTGYIGITMNSKNLDFADWINDCQMIQNNIGTLYYLGKDKRFFKDTHYENYCNVLESFYGKRAKEKEKLSSCVLSYEEKQKKIWEDMERRMSKPLPGEIISSNLPERVVVNIVVPQETALNLQNECDKIILEMKQLYRRYMAWKKTNRK